ncbi:MAG TPA: metal-dependent hydrolase [Chitinispirillaceae bacterium]|nr:metal-dependent hydrolase [Chitinispirillaceae bacterium]
MLIAHAPAGYLLTRLLSRTLFKNKIIPKRSDRLYQQLMFAGIIGAILPDFDFFYHFFMDPNKISHHSYISHMPVFWFSLMCILILTGNILKNNKISTISVILCSSAMLHLVCDTITGKIYWLYPLSSRGFNLFAVSDIHIWWVHNYMYHWTFLIEIAIVACAMVIFLRVKETASDIIEIYKINRKFRAIMLRVGVCTIGLVVIVVVGSLRFNVDKKIYRKAIELKHRVEKLASS